MSPLSQQALEMQHSPSRWDYVLEALLAVLLAFCPFAFGARDDWGQQVYLGLAAAWSPEIVLVLAAAMAFVLAGRQAFDRDARFVWSWTYLPIALFLLVALLQLAPLPAHLLASLSPQTLQIKTDLLGDLPSAPRLLRSLTLSFYPLATRHDLWMLMSVVTVFVVVMNVYRRSSQIKRLLLIISLIGFSEVLVAVYQNAFGVRTIYGGVAAYQVNSGTFLNHNAFSQFVNLSIGAMLALLLVRLREMTEGSHSIGESYQLLRYAKLNGVYALAGGIAISVATIFLSLSRGGVISLLIAAAITGILLIWRRGGGGINAILLMFAVGALLVVFYAAAGSVFERLYSLRNVAHDNGDRTHVVEYLMREFRQFPIFGTGLGTHRYIYPMYDQSVIFSIPAYAENEYMQLMEEAGAVGAALCLMFVGIVGASYFRSIWKQRRPVHFAAYGLGFGLIAILIQSATDFGQHDASNACLTATFSALLIVLARHARPVAERRHRSNARSRQSLWPARTLRFAGAVATIALFVLPLRDADAARRARVLWQDVQNMQQVLDQQGWEKGSDNQFYALLAPGKKAEEIDPQDVYIGYWINDFRWRSFERYRDPQTGALNLEDSSLRATGMIVGELINLRPYCPTFATPYSLAGRLEYFVLHDPRGERDIRTGYRLDHNDVDACLAVAELDAMQKNWKQSIAEAQRALELDYRIKFDILPRIYVQAGRPEIAFEMIKDDLDGVRTLGNMLRPDPKQKQLADRCDRQVRTLTLNAADLDDTQPYILADVAEIYEGDGDHANAIKYYEKAVGKDYARVDWKLRLAQLLAKSGNITAAEKEVRAILRLKPDMTEATKLLNELSAREADGK